MKRRQLECRIVLTYRDDGKFDMGMYDPVSGRYEALGTHPNGQVEKIVGDLRRRIDREGHRVTFSEVRAPR